MDDDERPGTNLDHRGPPHTGDPPGRCLAGRYLLLDHIGAGGGAVVVRARDRQQGRLVAIKLLRSRDPDLRHRFTQESEVLARLEHPAIVQVLAHDSDGDEPYTVLELIDGLDLHEHLLRSGPLPWRQVIDIGAQIAGALAVVHRHGLVHRDLKPANIMLDADGRVKLIDFGVVRITENYRVPTGAAPRRQTGMGKAMGTPGYLPLEAGLVAPNPGFDVFGLGATLYQLLTDTLPAEPLLPLRDAHPGCDAPDDLERVLAAALAQEPEDRTRTAAELGRALAAVRAAHPGRTTCTRVDGRYELIGLAGTGAKADAHLAVHRGAGHDVVIKFLRSSAPDDVLRFTREAKLLSCLDHPGIPRFYDHAPEATPPYIVMAVAPGRPASRLCSPPVLRPTEVAAIGIKLAQVLAVVHARGVIHRDVNASNVMIDEHGGVTLIDFGSAEITDKFYDVPAGARRYLTPPEARVSIPDGGIGRLAWSAPETRAGGKAWSDRSDVYSLAHLLFRLLTGKVPSKDADPPTSPLEFLGTCPEELASAITGGLCVDPQLRPNATQFAQSLIDALETEEALAPALSSAATRRAPTAPQAATEAALAPAVAPAATRRLPTAPQAATAAALSPALSPAATRRAPTAPLPDTSSGSITLLTEPPGPSPNPSTTRPSRAAPRRAWIAPIALVTLGVALWGMQGPTPEHADHPTLTAVLNLPGHPTPLAAAPPPAREPEPTPPMHEALDAATPALRRCSELAGGLLIVDFTTAPGTDTFASVSPSVSDSPALDECVRAATRALRFRPQHAEIVTKEYTP